MINISSLNFRQNSNTNSNTCSSSSKLRGLPIRLISNFIKWYPSNTCMNPTGYQKGQKTWANFVRPCSGLQPRIISIASEVHDGRNACKIRSMQRGCKVARHTGWQVHRVTSPIGKLLDPGVSPFRTLLIYFVLYFCIYLFSIWRAGAGVGHGSEGGGSQEAAAGSAGGAGEGGGAGRRGGEEEFAAGTLQSETRGRLHHEGQTADFASEIFEEWNEAVFLRAMKTISLTL